ncbi:secreted RxLR effector protein 161-like [Schistocerca americana]|uniref:secreted RxLR effector protein 161-like n=1 Tax=Schistocerca americana TaxID=7009 RepID=UPI001F5033CF|nr:secreted RxLR effector protein 161-like [Schistocerca americana]
MDDSKKNSAPFHVGTMLHSGQFPSNQHEVKEMKSKPYQQAVGSLMFAAIVSQPGIMFARSMVSRFLHNPGLGHLHAVKRIMKYLQQTRDLTIRYKADSTGLVLYSDADFAGVFDTCKPTTGYVSLLTGRPVTRCSHQQKCVSRSTMDAEYIAASDAAAELVWLRRFFNEFGFQLD